MLVLNVGGGSRVLPPEYDGWDQHLLDANPDVCPDVCMSMTGPFPLEMFNDYDAVYCSHALEHIYRHEMPITLNNFKLVLKSGGFVDIRVPDIDAMIKAMQQRSLDLDDVWYRVGGQPVTFHDVLYGWDQAMSAGNLFYAHKCGFTGPTLSRCLQAAGFENVTIGTDGQNLYAKATKP